MKTEQPIEQPWQNAMKRLIANLKRADENFTAAEYDRYGMMNFIQNVTNPTWKKVIEESQDDVKIILDSLADEEEVSVAA